MLFLFLLQIQKSLRGVLISSSLLEYGMFGCSTILISRFLHFISKRGGFGQLRYIIGFCLPYLSQDSNSKLQLVYLNYLELSLTVLHNSKITLFVKLSLSPLMHQKWKNNNNNSNNKKQMNKSFTKMHHGYICC